MRDKKISFLKIDVEGYEKEVLLGADFENYRPYLIVIEATVPGTDIWCYEQWENILLNAGYEYFYSYGVNRYYVAKEVKNIIEDFKTVEELRNIYTIYQGQIRFLM